MDKIYNYLLNVLKLKDKDIIVIGCSGGPDSMALMYILQKIREKIDISLICVHINHNVREESKQEEIFLRDYCEKNNIVFEAMTIEKYGDDNFHNEARKIRYHFYEEIINKYQAKYLMTAHHSDDLMETILMRIARGSTLKGYAGFEKEVTKDNYKLVRPLIGVTKDEIETFDKKNNIPYVIDKSNFKGKYTRNRYRMEVLPFLKKEDPLIHEKFEKFSETLLEYDEFVNSILEKVIKKVYKNGIINIPLLLDQSPLIQKKIIAYVLEELYPSDLNQINDTHLVSILNLVKSKRSNATIDLPGEYKAIKSYDSLKITKEVDITFNYEIEIQERVELPYHHSITVVQSEESNNNNVCRLLSSEINLPLYVRTRHLGDKMALKKISGSKKIKDIFIDSKVELELRDSWPIVVDSSNNILWVPGIKKSKFAKQKNEKYDIILKYN